MVYNGNPNQKNPYAFPTQQPPTQVGGYTNPFKYGQQRTAGQMAPQPNLYGMGFGTNTTPTVPTPQPGRQQQPVAQSPNPYFNAFQQQFQGAYNPQNMTDPFVNLAAQVQQAGMQQRTGGNPNADFKRRGLARFGLVWDPSTGGTMSFEQSPYLQQMYPELYQEYLNHQNTYGY